MYIGEHKADGTINRSNKPNIKMRSSVFDALVLLSFAFFLAPGADGVFAKSVSKGEAGPGAIGGTLPIEEQRIAFP